MATCPGQITDGTSYTSREPPGGANRCILEIFGDAWPLYVSGAVLGRVHMLMSRLIDFDAP